MNKKQKPAGTVKRNKSAENSPKKSGTCLVVVSQQETGFEAKCAVKENTQNHVIGQFGVLLARLILQSKETGTKIFDRDKFLSLRIEMNGKSFSIDAKLKIKMRSTSQISKFLVAANHAIANAYYTANAATLPQEDVYILTENLRNKDYVKTLTRPQIEIAKVLN